MRTAGRVMMIIGSVALVADVALAPWYYSYEGAYWSWTTKVPAIWTGVAVVVLLLAVLALVTDMLGLALAGACASFLLFGAVLEEEALKYHVYIGWYAGGALCILICIGALLGCSGYQRRRPSVSAAGYGAGAPAGWYADPSGASAMRYWSGTTWTEHTSG